MAEEQTIDYKAQYENAQKEIESLQKQVKTLYDARTKYRNIAYNKGEYSERLENLKCMEKLVRNINNGDYIDDWLMNGFPDDGTEEDFKDMAKNPGQYLEAASAFLRIMRYNPSVYEYFPFSHWGEKDAFGESKPHKDLYSKDIYGHKLAANKYTVKVHCPGQNATWRLKQDDLNKVLELLNTMEEIDESKLEDEE